MNINMQGIRFGAWLFVTILCGMWSSCASASACEEEGRPFYVAHQGLDDAMEQFRQESSPQTLKGTCEAAQDLLDELFNANRAHLDLCCPHEKDSLWSYIEKRHQAHWGALHDTASEDFFYPDNFVSKYVHGMTIFNALQVVNDLRLGKDVPENRRILSARFFVLAAHLSKTTEAPFHMFMEEEINHVLSPCRDTLFAYAAKKRARQSLRVLEKKESLDDVGEIFWTCMKVLPFDLKLLLVACGQDEEHPERMEYVEKLENDALKSLVLMGNEAECFENVAMGWKTLMSMDSGHFAKNHVSLKRHMAQCHGEEECVVKERIDLYLAQSASVYRRVKDVMHAFWQVERVLYETLCQERAHNVHYLASHYQALQDVWTSASGAVSLVEGCKLVLKDAHLLTLVRVKTFLEKATLEDAQENT